MVWVPIWRGLAFQTLPCVSADKLTKPQPTFFSPALHMRCQLTWPHGADLEPVSWRPTTVKWRQFSQSNRHSTNGTRQTEYHEALTSSANVQSHLTSSFASDGNASLYSVCRVPMVEWRLDCENCRHLTVVGLYDTGPWWSSCWARQKTYYAGRLALRHPPDWRSDLHSCRSLKKKKKKKKQLHTHNLVIYMWWLQGTVERELQL